ncbi:MAG TPA: pseudouridine-5'-phosphate glycosidase [Thermoleophilaceae bacterium]|nr:pseudouridine-5'-phosphate glycosidase [Thermoleophilaceae bacterium]
MKIAVEVAEALAAGQPVVALESTIITHGLPRPRNLEVAREVEAAVREGGALPATIAMVAGEARVGLEEGELAAVAERDDVVKCGVRDLAPLAARGGWGGTTVAATAHLAARAGIHLFATGGLGGVHRDARETWDESADLTTLARTNIVVVCAGVKSILDVGATLERLETLNVTVLGYGTDRFPGFYLSDSGHPVSWRVDSPAEVAAAVLSRNDLGTDDRALLVANPLPPDQQLDPALHDRVLADGLAAAESAGVAGKDATPFLLDFLARETGGESLEANVRLVVRNAGLAARIAAELST